MSKFIKYFKKTVNEAVADVQPMLGPTDDSQAFAQSFEDPESVQRVEGEMAGLGLDPEQRADLLKRADHYASKIDSMILPTLRKLHNDLVGGVFKTLAPDIKGIAKINEDLASLGEALRGRVRDAVIKSDKNEEKKSANNV